jgi:hypothetical protein
VHLAGLGAKNRGGQEDRAVLPAAQASMAADEGLESGHLERPLVNDAVDVQVGGAIHTDRTPQVLGSMRSKR